MKLIEIVNDKPDDDLPVKMTEEDLDKLVSKNGIQTVLSEYEIPESYLLKRKFNISIVFSCINPSEEFLKEAISSEYILPEDLKLVSTKSISNLSDKFIREYEEYFDWNRMMNYLMASEKIYDIEDYELVIEKNNLWNLVSSLNLPINFIRKYKDKLDWQYLAICREFNNEEYEEFKSYIDDSISRGEKMSLDLINSNNSLSFTENTSSEIIQAQLPDKESKFTDEPWIPTRMDIVTSLVKELSREEIDKLKTII